MFGTVAAAKSQFYGKALMFPTGSLSGFPSVEAAMKKATKATINTRIPTIPARAMNFNFSIFETKTGGISKIATMSTINHP